MPTSLHLLQSPCHTPLGVLCGLINAAPLSECQLVDRAAFVASGPSDDDSSATLTVLEAAFLLVSTLTSPFGAERYCQLFTPFFFLLCW